MFDVQNNPSVSQFSSVQDSNTTATGIRRLGEQVCHIRPRDFGNLSNATCHKKWGSDAFNHVRCQDIRGPGGNLISCVDRVNKDNPFAVAGGVIGGVAFAIIIGVACLRGARG